MIYINYRNKTKYDVNSYVDIFKQITRYTLKQFNLKGNFELSVTLVSKKMIRDINLQYRHIDKVTDVISFENDNDLIKVDNLITLGDLFICVNKAKMQAKEYGHSMYRELCFLFTHGLLHLLKMDHMNPQDEEKMITMQNNIMNHFKIIR